MHPSLAMGQLRASTNSHSFVSALLYGSVFIQALQRSGNAIFNK